MLCGQRGGKKTGGSMKEKALNYGSVFKEMLLPALLTVFHFFLLGLPPLILSFFLCPQCPLPLL